MRVDSLVMLNTFLKGIKAKYIIVFKGLEKTGFKVFSDHTVSSFSEIYRMNTISGKDLSLKDCVNTKTFGFLNPCSS